MSSVIKLNHLSAIDKENSQNQKFIFQLQYTNILTIFSKFQFQNNYSSILRKRNFGNGFTFSVKLIFS